MDNSIQKFLEFNNKLIYFLSVDGVYWIAIKPICEALSIDFERQRKNLKQDDFWNELPSIQTVVAADGKSRKMLCLPEQFIYGWICSIQSSSKDLILYKRKCYQVLYEYFHGTITQRSKLLHQNFEESLRIADIERQLSDNSLYAELVALKKGRKNRFKSLTELDKSLVTGQLKFF